MQNTLMLQAGIDAKLSVRMTRYGGHEENVPAVQTGNDIESREEEFKQISDTIALLKNRINAIAELSSSDNSQNGRLNQIQRVITEWGQSSFQYDGSIVCQKIECIKVYPDGKLGIIFGGGYIVEESIAAE